MNVLVAIDSFKGSISTFEAGDAVSHGIKRVFPEAEVTIAPLADGGEGTTEAVIRATHGRKKTVAVHDPLGRVIFAEYGILQNKTAVIEMAQAAGITLIGDTQKDPLHTTTYGVGEMIADALKEGCREFLIGIGGSATNDGGIGMLEALGVRFTDKRGNRVPRGAAGLRELANINTENMLPALRTAHFSVACDVENPLCGEKGCSAVFGPQKGATPETIPLMDGWLSHYAALTQACNPTADPDAPGCGAAGGLGFAFLSYLNAELRSGIALVIEATGLEQQIQKADIVITGEGRLDGQTCMGKAPVGIAALSKKYGKPVIAVSGSVTADAVLTHAHGIDAFFPIVRKPCSLAEAMDSQNTMKNLADTTEQIFRLIRTFSCHIGK